MQSNEAFAKERRRLLASGQFELAEIRRRARNRLVMSPYKHTDRNCYLGNDDYFVVTAGKDIVKMILQREYPEIEAEDYE